MPCLYVSCSVLFDVKGNLGVVWVDADSIFLCKENNLFTVEGVTSCPHLWMCYFCHIHSTELCLDSIWLTFFKRTQKEMLQEVHTAQNKCEWLPGSVKLQVWGETPHINSCYNITSLTHFQIWHI